MDSEEIKINQAADLLKVLAHSIRMQVVLLLAQHDQLAFSTIRDELEVGHSLLSHHLVKMSDKGLLSSRRQGTQSFYSLTDPSLVAIPKLLFQSVITGQGRLESLN